MSEINKTLESRGENYGSFNTQAEISQSLKEIAESSRGWSNMEDFQKEGMQMILHKIARIVNGNPYHADSWHDIAGYAILVENELNK